MVAIFAVFATLRLLDMKQMGVGLAVAVLLDVDDRARPRAAGGDHAARRARAGACRDARRRGGPSTPRRGRRPRMASEELDAWPHEQARRPARGSALVAADRAVRAGRVRRHADLWALTGGGYFWPVWVWFGLAIAARRCTRRDRACADAAPGPHRALRIHARATGVIAPSSSSVWALTGGGDVLARLAAARCSLAALAVHAIVRPAIGRGAREQELEERVDELTRTRRGARRRAGGRAAADRARPARRRAGAARRADACSSAGRRSGSTTSPSWPSWCAQAREEAGSAIAELRDLARGIAPPVLADRGLAAAVEGLGRRSAIPVDGRRGRSTERPPPVRRDGGVLRRRRGAHERRQARAAARPRACALRRRATRSSSRSSDSGAGRRRPRRRRADRPAPPRRGARRPADRDQPAGRRHDRASGAAVRVVIAEDLALLREGIVALLRERRHRRRRAGRGRRGAAAHRRRPQAGPRDRRRAAAADVHRRGAARGDRGAPAPARARRPDPLPVRRAGLHERAARLRRGRRRLPAQGARRRRARRSSTRSSASPPAARRSTARSWPSSCARATAAAARSPSSRRASARCWS